MNRSGTTAVLGGGDGSASAAHPGGFNPVRPDDPREASRNPHPRLRGTREDRAVQRHHVSTSNAAEAEAAVRAILGDGSFLVGEGAFGYEQWAMIDDEITLARIGSNGQDLRVNLERPRELVGVIVREGRLTLSRAQDTAVLDAGGCGLIPLFEPTEMRWNRLRADLFCLRASSAATFLPRATAVGRLQSSRLTPRSAELGRFWNMLARLISSQVLSDPVVNASELIRSSALQAFAAATIETFDLIDESPAEQRSATAILDDVDTYLREHLGDSISIADVARALHISPRTLQLTYQHAHRGTVTGHLRGLRIEAAHAALLERRGGTTVTAVARRFGYTNVGRFAAHYRARYEQSPTMTLQGANIS